MIPKLLSKRPVLVGGLGLAASLSLLGGLQPLFLDDSALVSLLAVSAGVWWWRRQDPPAESTELKPVTPVGREAVEAALASLETDLLTLNATLDETNSSVTEANITMLASRRQALLEELDRSTLRVAIAGASRSGKSTLAQRIQSTLPKAELALTEMAFTAATSHQEVMATLAQHQDVVVYLVTEDLTESILTDLAALTTAGQRVLLTLSKQDNYLPDDCATVLERIKVRLRGLSQLVEVAAIAAAPNPIKVRTHSDDGQITERLEVQRPDVEAVTKAIKTWLTEDRVHLTTQTVMRQTQQLRRDIQLALNAVRREQALPVVEQLQWTAAATAFASPVPSLDLLAAIAINGQLVMDLGRIYQQPLALDQAKTIASELAAIVARLGLVEVSTQLLTTALKSHAATFVVGGSVQAFSAAYLTRLCGESLMTYFEDRALSGQAETALSVEAIGQKLQAVLPTTQRTEFLQNLVKQGINKFKPTIHQASTIDVQALPQAATVAVSVDKVDQKLEVESRRAGE